MRLPNPMPKHRPIFLQPRSCTFSQASPAIHRPGVAPKSAQKQARNESKLSETEAVTPTIPKYPAGLRAAGKRKWRDIHVSGDFTGAPETMAVIEQVCFLADEIARQQKVIREAGSDTRVRGYNGQPVSMPEVTDLQRNQQLYLSYLKAIRVDPPEGEKLSRSEIGKLGADARWGL